MKKALIMGITGGFAGNMARELLKQGWQLSALMRDPARLPKAFKGIQVHQGDAGDIQSVRTAAHDVDLIVYGISPANYDWKDKAEPWLDNAARVAEERQLTFVFPGNVYVLNPADGPLFDEQTRLDPVTDKGRTRKAMEQRLQQASEKGAHVIIIRMGDFIGRDAASTWFQHLIKEGKKQVSLTLPGPIDHRHTWAYLPDVAYNVVELLRKQESLPAFSVFHYRGHELTGRQLAQSIGRVTGKPVKTGNFPWFVLRMIAPFSILYRGLVEMRYLWQHDIVMSDDKLTRTLGHAPRQTPIEQVLREYGLGSQQQQFISSQNTSQTA